MSHSTRVRGLKLGYSRAFLKRDIVALYTSAWIEILCQQFGSTANYVALYTSAWIEI